MNFAQPENEGSDHQKAVNEGRREVVERGEEKGFREEGGHILFDQNQHGDEHGEKEGRVEKAETDAPHLQTKRGEWQKPQNGQGECELVPKVREIFANLNDEVSGKDGGRDDLFVLPPASGHV